MRESASTDLREPQGSNPLGPPGPELVTGRMETNGNPNFSSPQSGDWRRSSSSAVHGSFTPKASVIPVENPPEIPQGIVASYRIQGWLRVLPYGKKEAQESLASKDRG